MMEVREAIKRKGQLEADILGLIQAFQDDTGLRVDGLDIRNVTATDNDDKEILFMQKVVVSSGI